MIRTYIARSGQTAYDIVIEVYGTLAELYRFVSDNNIDLSQPISSGQAFIYDDSIGIELPFVVDAKPVVISTERSYRGIDGQSIYDVAVITIGGFEGFFDMLKNSGIDSALDVDARGVVFNYSTNQVKDENVSLFLKRLGTAAGGTLDRPTPPPPPPPIPYYLLKEDGFYLLQENGFKIIIE